MLALVDAFIILTCMIEVIQGSQRMLHSDRDLAQQFITPFPDV